MDFNTKLRKTVNHLFNPEVIVLGSVKLNTKWEKMLKWGASNVCSFLL